MCTEGHVHPTPSLSVHMHALHAGALCLSRLVARCVYQRASWVHLQRGVYLPPDMSLAPCTWCVLQGVRRGCPPLPVSVSIQAKGTAELWLSGEAWVLLVAHLCGKGFQAKGVQAKSPRQARARGWREAAGGQGGHSRGSGQRAPQQGVGLGLCSECGGAMGCSRWGVTWSFMEVPLVENRLQGKHKSCWGHPGVPPL